MSIIRISCDLLKNIYLCGSNNNHHEQLHRTYPVVICLKISIFVVATTTIKTTDVKTFQL